MMLAHNILSGRATEPKPELGDSTQHVFSPEVIDITGEEMAASLAASLAGQTDDIVERLIAANTEAKLGQPDHPPGFCPTAHCQQAQADHDSEITKAAGDKIFSILSTAAKNLGLNDVADALARDYMAIAAGNDPGPGFYLGETRMVSGHPAEEDNPGPTGGAGGGGEHCADLLQQHEATQRQQEVATQQARAKWIFQQVDHAARDLNMVDQWQTLKAEYTELANGRDRGPGYWIGSTRIVGGDKYPYITFSRNGDVYHSPA